MNSTGRVTLPVDARRALGLQGESFFEVTVENGAVVLRPVAIVPLDQARGIQPGSPPG
jgi:bifunctional DNA-binding transcriptional regulator/antitoxin component of YhaV-PrlF toxin-antitoxin module